MRHAIAVLALGLAAHAANAQDTPRKPRPPKATQRVSVQIIPAPSHESPAERDRRLRRECKGRPSGGACLGYTN